MATPAISESKARKVPEPDDFEDESGSESETEAAVPVPTSPTGECSAGSAWSQIELENLRRQVEAYEDEGRLDIPWGEIASKVGGGRLPSACQRRWTIFRKVTVEPRETKIRTKAARPAKSEKKPDPEKRSSPPSRQTTAAATPMVPVLKVAPGQAAIIDAMRKDKWTWPKISNTVKIPMDICKNDWEERRSHTHLSTAEATPVRSKKRRARSPSPKASVTPKPKLEAETDAQRIKAPTFNLKFRTDTSTSRVDGSSPTKLTVAERRELFLTNELKEDLDPQTRAAYEVELTRLDMERARKSRGA